MAGDLYTPRLHLRPLEPSDEDLYCRLYTDHRVMRHVAPPLSREAALRAFGLVLRRQVIEPPRSRCWILVSREGGDALGLMAWLPDPDDPGSAEVGVLLAARAQGRGHATEAIAALADVVFAATAQRRLWTRHAPDNGLAAGLMRKLGFEPVPEAVDGPAPLRWQLEREHWSARRGTVFAAPPATC